MCNVCLKIQIGSDRLVNFNRDFLLVYNIRCTKCILYTFFNQLIGFQSRKILQNLHRFFLYSSISVDKKKQQTVSPSMHAHQRNQNAFSFSSFVFFHLFSDWLAQGKCFLLFFLVQANQSLIEISSAM